MAADTINELFRDEVGVISRFIDDRLFEDTILPWALQRMNAICRQTLSISDYTQATVGSVTIEDAEVGDIEVGSSVDHIISLYCCFRAWQIKKRDTTLRGRMEFRNYQEYLYDAWDEIGDTFPNVVEWSESVGHSVPRREDTQKVTAHMEAVVGDSTKEGGVRYVPANQNVRGSER